MKFLRLASLTLTCSSFCFAANKDLIAMQRDLEARMDAMQQSLNSKIDVLSGMVTAMQGDTRRTADQLAGMQDVLRTTVANALGPVTGLNSKVETTSEDVRALRDALADLSARMERMDAKITDLKNQLQIMQNPPAAPGTTAPGTIPPGTSGQAAGQSGPPAGMSAAQAYTDAFRDKQTGNIDLAYQEFQQYLTYFPNTEYAADAQYYLGEIDYNRHNHKAAIQEFDAVLERYPDNHRTRDAHLMKGLALAKDGQRTKAAQELRSLIQNFPTSEQARRAQQALHDPTLFPSTGTSTARRKTAP
jgi:tol-pal system protein YbgF